MTEEVKSAATAAAATASMTDVEKKMSSEEEELMEMSIEELVARTRALDNSLRERKSEIDRINREITTIRGRVKENEDKVNLGKQLPFLVSTVVELVPDCEAGIEDAINAGAVKKNQKKQPNPASQAQNGLMPMKKKTLEEEKEELTCAVVKTSLRQTIYLPVIGLVPSRDLNPGDLVGLTEIHILS